MMDQQPRLDILSRAHRLMRKFEDAFKGFEESASKVRVHLNEVADGILKVEEEVRSEKGSVSSPKRNRRRTKRNVSDVGSDKFRVARRHFSNRVWSRWRLDRVFTGDRQINALFDNRDQAKERAKEIRAKLRQKYGPGNYEVRITKARSR